jgi:hypothetical protein
VILFIGCTSNDKVTGDTNSSETQNTISLTKSNGTPAARMSVQIVSTVDWSSDILASTSSEYFSGETDASGRVSLPEVLPNSFVLIARDAAEGVSRLFELNISTPQILTAPLLGYSGHIAGAPPINNRVCLEYTNFCTEIGLDGSYSFQQIPPNSYQALIVRPETSELISIGQKDISVLQTTPDSLWYAPEFLLLEDFEDQDNYGLLYSWNGSGAWWIFNLGGTTTPESGSVLASGIFNDNTAYLRMNVNIPNPDPDSMALLGIQLGLGTYEPDSLNVFADIRELDSISFRLNSYDTIHVFLQAKATLDLGDEKHFFQKIPPTQGWKTVSIYPEDFIPIPYSLAVSQGISISEVLEDVASIVFDFKKSGIYEIDDVKLHGVQVLRLKNW